LNAFKKKKWRHGHDLVFPGDGDRQPDVKAERVSGQVSVAQEESQKLSGAKTKNDSHSAQWVIRHNINFQITDPQSVVISFQPNLCTCT
jgi:hypothetical protein